jgi:Uma2 family endonuclease
MTQAKSRFERFETFEAYLSCSDALSDTLEGRFQLRDGVLVELPPESEQNDFFANRFMVLLFSLGLVPLRLIRVHTCEVQVPVLQPKDPANRYPDLVILREEHLSLTQRRLTLTLTMPPPRLIAEFVSPGQTNRDRDYIDNRDYIDKRSQYAALGVPEYWIIDRIAQTVLILELEGDRYNEIGQFQGNAPITSPTFPTLTLTPAMLVSQQEPEIL